LGHEGEREVRHHARLVAELGDELEAGRLGGIDVVGERHHGRDRQRTGPPMTCSTLTPDWRAGEDAREPVAGAPAISGPMPRRSASCWKIKRSERDSPTGSITWFTPPMML